MENKKSNYPLLIIISIILLSIIGIMYFEEDNNIAINKKESNYSLLKDYSMFYTIDSCVNKYIDLLAKNSVDDILLLLDSNYINDNKITKDNVFKYINKIDGVYSFKTKEIYNKDNENSYYVYGNLIKESINGLGEKIDYYVIINIDKKNRLFSVIPDDGSKFMEVSNG